LRVKVSPASNVGLLVPVIRERLSLESKQYCLSFNAREIGMTCAFFDVGIQNEDTINLFTVDPTVAVDLRPSEGKVTGMSTWLPRWTCRLMILSLNLSPLHACGRGSVYHHPCPRITPHDRSGNQRCPFKTTLGHLLERLPILLQRRSTYQPIDTP
jgi:hypothetical protein